MDLKQDLVNVIPLRIEELLVAKKNSRERLEIVDVKRHATLNRPAKRKKDESTFLVSVD
jgi:hypothetical protein